MLARTSEQPGVIGSEGDDIREYFHVLVSWCLIVRSEQNERSDYLCDSLILESC